MLMVSQVNLLMCRFREQFCYKELLLSLYFKSRKTFSQIKQVNIWFHSNCNLAYSVKILSEALVKRREERILHAQASSSGYTESESHLLASWTILKVATFSEHQSCLLWIEEKLIRFFKMHSKRIFCFLKKKLNELIREHHEWKQWEKLTDVCLQQWNQLSH